MPGSGSVKHPSKFTFGIGLSRNSVSSGFQVFDWWLHLASPILGFRPGLAAWCAVTGRLGELLLLPRPLTFFDLRVGKITRRI